MVKKGKRQYFYMNRNGNVVYTDDQAKLSAITLSGISGR
jgi:hypothetical protein